MYSTLQKWDASLSVQSASGASGLISKGGKNRCPRHLNFQPHKLIFLADLMALAQFGTDFFFSSDPDPVDR